MPSSSVVRIVFMVILFLDSLGRARGCWRSDAGVAAERVFVFRDSVTRFAAGTSAITRAPESLVAAGMSYFASFAAEPVSGSAAGDG